MPTAIVDGWSWEISLGGQTVALDAIATTVAVGLAIVVATGLVSRRMRQAATPGTLTVVVQGSLRTIGGYVTAGPDWSRRRIETLAFTLFWFVLLSHWLHIIPALTVHAPTSDISVTLALAVVTLVVIQLTVAQAVGWRAHLRHFVSPVYLLPLRVFELVSKTLSLSLRLFGVLFASIVIVEVVNDVLAPPATVVPLTLWTAFDLVMAVVQAYIFALLACTYYNLAMQETDPRAGSGNPTGASALSQPAHATKEAS